MKPEPRYVHLNLRQRSKMAPNLCKRHATFQLRHAVDRKRLNLQQASCARMPVAQSLTSRPYTVFSHSL